MEDIQSRHSSFVLAFPEIGDVVQSNCCIARIIAAHIVICDFPEDLDQMFRTARRGFHRTSPSMDWIARESVVGVSPPYVKPQKRRRPSPAFSLVSK